jgi:16S rRNA (adenine1518-N6/adenine1519-N6)-dimethyltransferase
VRTRRQRLGQHFLRDSQVARDVALALPTSPPRVLEVGPGRGALTRELLARFPHVRAVELDAELAAGLPGRLSSPDGLEVWHADALADDLEVLGAGGPWLVAANLPYAVATPIVRRFIHRHGLFPHLVVMVQQEVAERMVAPAGSARRGLLTLEVECFSWARLLFTVPPGAFAPPPKVHSAVVSLATHGPEGGEESARAALALAARAFTHRRKKVTTALRGNGTVVAEVLDEAGYDRGARPQELSLAAWRVLATALSAEPGPGGGER